MSETQNTEAMVQDQNLTPAPETGAEQNETSESMESKEQIAPVATLGQQLAGDEATKVPTAETPDAQAAEEDTTESTEEEVDGTTDTPTEEELAKQTELQAKRENILAELNAGRRVELRDFRAAGFRFADMDDTLQRKETMKDSRQLLESLKVTKAFYRPIEVLPVSELIEAGHPCFKLNGKEILPDDPDYALYFARPDGKQRTIAYAKLMSDPNYKGKESEYNAPIIRCPIPVDQIETYVREIQTAAVWDEKTKRQTVVAKLGGTESGLTLMNTFMMETGMSARGAYKLIYRKEGYNKDLYEQSMRNGALADGLKASEAIIKRARGDYESLRVAFRNHGKYLKNSIAPDSIIEIYTSETEHPNEAVEAFLTFLQALQAEDFTVLDSYNSVSEKKTALLSLYNEHKENQERDPAYAALVEERVETAKNEYKAIVAKEAAEAKVASVKTTVEAKYYSI